MENNQRVNKKFYENLRQQYMVDLQKREAATRAQERLADAGASVSMRPNISDDSEVVGSGFPRQEINQPVFPKRNSNLFALNQSRGDDLDQVASAAFLASHAGSDGGQRDGTRLSAGERTKELPGRHHGSTQSDPIFSTLVVVGASTPLAQEKDLDTIEQVEPSSPALRTPMDHGKENRLLGQDPNRTHEVSRRGDFFAADNADTIDDLQKLEDQMKTIIDSFKDARGDGREPPFMDT